MHVFPHLNHDELRERMKTSATVRQRLRWQVIFLAHQGQSSVEIAQTVATATVGCFIWLRSTAGTGQSL